MDLYTYTISGIVLPDDTAGLLLISPSGMSGFRRFRIVDVHLGFHGAFDPESREVGDPQDVDCIIWRFDASGMISAHPWRPEPLDPSAPVPPIFALEILTLDDAPAPIVDSSVFAPNMKNVDSLRWTFGSGEEVIGGGDVGVTVMAGNQNYYYPVEYCLSVVLSI